MGSSVVSRSDSADMAEWTLPLRGGSPRQARRLAARWLADRQVAGPGVDNVILVCSELVTNVVLHASGPVVLSVGLSDRGVLVEVGDSAPDGGMLGPQGSGVRATSGRGLAIVEALSSEWGVTVEPHSKTVWAVVEAD